MFQLPFIQRLAREKALSRYLTALEQGDMHVVIAVLEQSAQDAALEEMIFAIHEDYDTAEEFLDMLQEGNVMEIEDGVHKSKLRGQQNEAERERELPPVSKRQRSRYARWLQVLAAVLLVVCL